MEIGIVGQGYVGTAIKVGFEPHYDYIHTYDKFDISKFTIKTAIWNEYEIITSILYNYEARGWWSENEKSLEPTLDIG